VNLGCGVLAIKPRTFIVATVLGTIPGSVIMTQAGRHLRSIQSMGEVLSPSGVAILGLLAFLALFPVLFRWARARGRHATIEGDGGSHAFNPRA
jgi:uncharacterized membrane protein YdjX (TVP38/TMEM64 family)